jgi:hypothetical protein
MLFYAYICFDKTDTDNHYQLKNQIISDFTSKITYKQIKKYIYEQKYTKQKRTTPTPPLQ